MMATDRMLGWSEKTRFGGFFVGCDFWVLGVVGRWSFRVFVGCAGPRTVCAPAFALGLLVVFVSAFAGRFVSRLTRDSLFPVAEKVSKKACPYLGLALRSRSPRYVVAPGVGVQGHPWPHACRSSCRSTPYATTPLGLAVNGAGRSPARSQARSRADQDPLPQAG